MCTSLSDKGCGSELTTDLQPNLQPEECTGTKMREWQLKIKQHKILNLTTWFFDMDEGLQDYRNFPNMNMACSKMTLHILKQDVTIRTCQTAKTESIDPCKTIEGKLENNQHIEMNKCDLCLTDACNNATFISPYILYILLSFLGSFVHVAFYRLA
ncbi:PREDICTED: uncharacterized protein LOC106740859 isoform X2 [Dinoponera quadriceps]|nr:PREDICTED: uncharacterized protein LOC106740859 isoform X2 [Dinoponera quadriceps]